MNKSLFQIQFRSLWNTLFGKVSRTKKRRGITKVLMGLLAIYVIVCIFLSSGFLFYEMAAFLVPAGLSLLYFSVAGLFSLLLCFIGTIFTVHSQLFRAKDNEFLLSLPIRPSSVLLSRLFLLMLMEVILLLPIILPAIFVYGAFAAITPLQILFLIAGCVLLLCLSTALSTACGWITTVLSLRIRHHNFITVVLTLLLFVGFYGAFFGLQNYFSDLLIHGHAIQSALQIALPPVYWFGQLCLGNASALFPLLLWCLLPFGGVCLLLAKTFWKLALSSPAPSKQKSTAAAKDLRSPLQTLLFKEFKRFFTLPAYMLNTTVGCIFSLLFSAFLLLNQNALELMFQEAIPETLIFPICMGILAFFSVLNNASSVALSLEGKSLWILKGMPVPPPTVILAKTLPSVVLNLPFLLLNSIVCWITFSLSLPQGLLLLLIPQLLNALSALSGVVVNLHLPNFDWVNETLLIKQSASSIVAALSALGFLLIPGLLYLPLYGMISAELYFSVWAFLFLAAILGFWHYLKTRGAQRFNHL